MKSWFIFIFKLMEAYNIFIYFQIMHIIMIIYQKFNVKLTLNIILITLLISNLLVTYSYFYDANVFEIFYQLTIYSIEEFGFIILLPKVLIYFLVFMSKNYLSFKLECEWTSFYFIMLSLYVSWQVLQFSNIR
jgi:hypothetical protein